MSKTVGDYKVWDGDIKDMPVVRSLDFQANGIFVAIDNARAYLDDEGFVLGSMQRGEPIGFAPRATTDYISKWRNMDREDKRTLAGIIVPIGDFREGGARVLYFEQLAPTGRKEQCVK